MTTEPARDPKRGGETAQRADWNAPGERRPDATAPPHEPEEVGTRVTHGLMAGLLMAVVAFVTIWSPTGRPGVAALVALAILVATVAISPLVIGPGRRRNADTGTT